MPNTTITTLPVPEMLTTDNPTVEWLVPDFLPRQSCILLAGEPGAGKSFLCYTLSLALATGRPFLHWPLLPKKVCYFDQENSYPD